MDTIAQAKKKIQSRAKERFEQEQAEYEEKVARRKVYEEEMGEKVQGRHPAAPSDEPQPQDQS